MDNHSRSRGVSCSYCPVAVVERARGTPCGYCAVPVLHPNQQCCLNCKNNPFDIIEPDYRPRYKGIGEPTPPISPTSPARQRERTVSAISPTSPISRQRERTVSAVSETGKRLVLEVRNVYTGELEQISADDLKDDAFWKHCNSGLIIPHEAMEKVEEPAQEHERELMLKSDMKQVISSHAVGIKLNGNAFGKTCLFAGDQFILDRADDNMAGSVIVHGDEEEDGEPATRVEFSISEDSINYVRVLIKEDARAWYDEDNGHPADWLFEEKCLYEIDTDDGDEVESDFDMEDPKLHGVVFNRETEARYIGPDNLYENRFLVECEGVEFSVKRANIIVEVEVTENSYAQKLKEDYSDLEQFWFQGGDMVLVLRDDQSDEERVIARYEDEEFSIAREDLDISYMI